MYKDSIKLFVANEKELDFGIEKWDEIWHRKMRQLLMKSENDTLRTE